MAQYESKIHAILNIKIKEVLSLPFSWDSKTAEAQMISDRYSNFWPPSLVNVPIFFKILQ